MEPAGIFVVGHARLAMLQQILLQFFPRVLRIVQDDVRLWLDEAIGVGAADDGRFQHFVMFD